MKKITALVMTALTLTAVGSTAAAQSSGPNEAAFTAWAAASGTQVNAVACHTAAVAICYGLDPTGRPIVAAVAADGTVTAVYGAPTATPSGDFGTRSNPIPVGTAAAIDSDWTVTVNSVNHNAWDAIRAANSFNDPPADGNVYVIVNLTTTYTGSDDGVADYTMFSAVSSSAVQLERAWVVAPDSYESMTNFFPGGSKTGNIAFEVPAGEVDSLVFIAEILFGGDAVYFATR